MLVYREDSILWGMRMYNKSGAVVFTTGCQIEDVEYRSDANWKII